MVQIGEEKDLRISAESLAAKGEKSTGLTTCISDPFPKLKGFGPKKVTLTDFPIAFLWEEKKKKKISNNCLIFLHLLATTHSDRCFSPPSL